jgi:hypothetical protein
MYLVTVVTRVFLLDKLGYFIDTGVALLLPMNACYLSRQFYFDIMWLVPWLCSCFFFHCYHNDDVF